MSNVFRIHVRHLLDATEGWWKFLQAYGIEEDCQLGISASGCGVTVTVATQEFVALYRFYLLSISVRYNYDTSYS